MKEIIVSILLIGGSLFILISSLGLFRFKDLLSRIHATTKATSFGIIWLLLAASLSFGTWGVAFKILLVALFIYLTAPLSAHAIGQPTAKRQLHL